MIYKSSRRSLLKHGTGLILAYGARGIIPGALWSISRVAKAASYRDLNIRTGVPAVNQPISNLVLRAEALRDGVAAMGLNGFEGPQNGGHDHPIIVTAEQIAQLNAGQTVNGQTQGVNGDNNQHNHSFSIAPNDFASTRVLEEQAPAPKPENESSEESSSVNASTDGKNNSFEMTLSKDENPYLIVECNYKISPTSMRFTLSENGKESKDYQEFGEYAYGGNRNIYRSKNKVQMNQVRFIHVFGRNNNGELLHDIFEIGRR